MRKRLLSSLLCLCLALTLLPTAAWALEGHSHDGVAFSAWSSNNALPTNAGNYYLTTDVTLSSNAAWSVKKPISLCLNGHKITQTAADHGVIQVEAGQTLNIHDCDGSHGSHTITSKSGGGSVTIHGGLITGGNITSTNRAGAGIYIYGACNLYAGTLAGNAAPDDASGTVYVKNGGSFHMYGGSISHNYAGYGAGVTTAGDSTIEGGVIESNKALYGGGACTTSAGTLVMKNGAIQNNTSTSSGGGVHALGAFVMENGTISGNTTTGTGGGINISAAAFTMKGGTIEGNQGKWGGGVGLAKTSSTFTMEGGTVQNNTATYGNALYILTDCVGPVSLSGGTLKGGAYIGKNTLLTLAKALPEGTSLAVTTGATPTADAPVKVAQGSGYTLAAADLAKLTSATYPLYLKDNAIYRHAHSWAEGWSKDKDGHWHACGFADCPVTDNSKKSGYAAHTPATDAGEDATCTTDGKTAGSHCSVCGYVILAQETIPAGHKYSETWSKDATQHWHACSVCHIKKDGADHTWDGGEQTTDPTCTDKGVKTYTCTVCGQTRTEPVNASGHTWSETYEKDEDQHWKKCTVCQTAGTKADHTWNGGEQTEAPTCTEAGVKTYTCTACKATRTEPVAAKGHDWGAWTMNAAGTAVTRVCKRDAKHTEEKPLTITLDTASYVYSGGENKPTLTVKVDGVALTLGAHYTVRYQGNVDVGAATATVVGKGSYAGSVDKTFAITPQALAATSATATGRAYDGTKVVSVTAVTLDGVVGEDAVAVDTTNLKGTLSASDAGSYAQVTLQGLTLTGAKAGNYTLTQPNVTLPTAVTISKAKAPATTPGHFNITNSLEKEYNYLLSLLCPQINEDTVTADRKDWGERRYELVDVTFTEDGYYDQDKAAYIDKALENGTYINRLYLPIQFCDSQTAGQVGEVEVKISSTNYQDFTNTVAVIATNKTAVDFAGVSTPDKTYDGRPYQYVGTVEPQVDGVYAAGADVEITYVGRGNTGYAERATPPTNAGTFAMIVRVADTDQRYIGRKSYNFEICKAPGEGSVTMGDYVCGATPSVPVAASATNGTDGVSYAYKVKGAGNDTYSPTKPTAAGAYTVRAEFPAALNYTAVTATADFAVSHVYAQEWTGEESGHYHLCVCGDKGDLAAHTPGDWIVDREATLEAAGSRHKACTVCGYVMETEAIPKLEPDPGPDQPDPPTPPTPDEGKAKGEVEVKPGTPAVSVDKEILKDLAGEVPEGQTVTVKLTVETKEDPADKAELESVMVGDKEKVLYLDLSLLKQVNDAEPEAITNAARVLEIAVDYDFTGKKDVTAYRKHGDAKAEVLTKLAARPAKDFADWTFFDDGENGVVYIYASKFSTYAIGYTAQAEEPTPTPSRRPSRRPDRGEETVTLPFVDVASTDPFFDAVRYVYENKLMVGTSETTFVPNGTLTRGMLAVILYRQAGSPEVEGAPQFEDTLADTWYSDAIVWAAQTQVLRGYGNGQFGPSDPVSKEMMNMVTARQAGEDPEWTGDLVLAVPATRAEIAQVLMERKK